MLSRVFLSSIFAGALLISSSTAQSAASTVATTPAATTSFPTLTATTGTNSTTSSSSNLPSATTTGPPDVYLNVPQLSVGRIELDVDNLEANINLAAQVASLVTINAGVQLGVSNINVTISDIDVQLELIIRLGNLVNIVDRVFQSVDLNPLLVSLANTTTSVLGDVVGAVDSLLGSVTQGGTTLSFIVDNLGNIVQQTEGTAGSLTSSIVGNYLNNMTYTGQSSDLGGGNTQKTYSYAPLNALVDIVTNTAGQVVQATVDKSGSSSTSSAATAATSAAKRR